MTAAFQPRAGPRTVLGVEGLNLLSGYGEAGVNTGSSPPGAADARSAWTGAASGLLRQEVRPPVAGMASPGGEEQSGVCTRALRGESSVAEW